MIDFNKSALGCTNVLTIVFIMFKLAGTNRLVMVVGTGPALDRHNNSRSVSACHNHNRNRRLHLQEINMANIRIVDAIANDIQAALLSLGLYVPDQSEYQTIVEDIVVRYAYYVVEYRQDSVEVQPLKRSEM